MGSPASPVQVPPSEHLVQLFDSVESLGETVARFFLDGVARGERLLCVAKPAHVQAIAGALGRHGRSLGSLVDSKTLIVLDASTTLRLITRRGAPDIAALRTVVENAVEQLASDGRRICVYGELVELLAEEGNFHGAEQVERFWNGFGEDYPIALLCGYSSAHFVMPGTLAALESICSTHQHVLQNRQDLLANWVLSRRTATAAASA